MPTTATRGSNAAIRTRSDRRTERDSLRRVLSRVGVVAIQESLSMMLMDWCNRDTAAMQGLSQQAVILRIQRLRALRSIRADGLVLVWRHGDRIAPASSHCPISPR